MSPCLSGMCVSYNRHQYRQTLPWGVSNLLFLVVWPKRCSFFYAIAWPKQMEKTPVSLRLRKQSFMVWATQALCTSVWQVHIPETESNNKYSTSDGYSVRNTHLPLVHKICLPMWLPLRECPERTSGIERGDHKPALSRRRAQDARGENRCPSYIPAPALDVSSDCWKAVKYTPRSEEI